MTFVAGPKTGLPTTIDLDDTTWTEKYLTGNSTLEARISLTSAGDPNGAVVGSWYGQPCWNTARGEVWECVKPGPATGSTRAEWIPRSPVPVGAIMSFWRSTAPAGWLPFTGGVYNRVSYPALYDALPAGVTKTASTFTLPNLRGGLTFFRYPDGTEPNYPTIGMVRTDFGVEETDLVDWKIINVLFGIKF